MNTSQGPLQGGIFYDEKGGLWSRILNGVIDILKDAGGAVIEHAPEILQGVATGLAATSLNQSGYFTPKGVSRLNPEPSPSLPYRKPAPAPAPYQPVEIPEAKPSSIVRDTLKRLESEHQRRLMEIPEYTQPRPLLELTRQNTGQMAPRPSRPQAADTEIFETPPSSSDALLRALDPNFGRGPSAPVQEDWAQIEANLAHASSPLTYQQQVQQAQARQLAELQRQNQQAQLRLAEEQSQLIKQHLEQESPKNSQIFQSDSKYRSQLKKRIESLITTGNIPVQNELRQIFHESDLAFFDARNNIERMFIRKDQDVLSEALAYNMSYGPNQKLLGDGYIVVNGSGYQPQFALDIAKKYLLYFQRHEKFPEPPFPTGEKSLDRKKHDITHEYDRYLKMVGSEMERLSPIQGLFALKHNFPNNGQWDMQGRPDFPGQALRLDRNGRPISHPKKPGRFDSIDQYALYNGKARRAGWFSNYIFGYASAAGRLPLEAALIIANGVSLLNNQRLDNPADLQAIIEGYQKYQVEFGK
ncbi:MAG: hypothetical protein IPK79_08305 [Vampirovibrionales bacterium]|nr:hypothetical protein [Vampirovibrionales bacterium]